MDTRALKRLCARLKADIAAGDLPGAVLLVEQCGDMMAFDALGMQDATAGTPMRQDSIFRIYSMTKPIVSFAAMMLVEEGALAVSDPVAKYLPEFANQQVLAVRGGEHVLEPVRRAATVQDLLRHTSGLTYEFLGDDPVQRMYRESGVASRELANRDAARLLGGLPLAWHPGERWQYSRSTDVLGAVLEVASGQPLGQLLQERILGPLAMVDTAFHVAAEKHHRIAEPLAVDPDSGAPVVLIDVHAPVANESGGGGLVSTAHDYARFLRMMLNGGRLDGVRLASRKTVAWMTADHLGGTAIAGDLLPPGHGFGLGVAVRTDRGLAHTAGSAGMYFWSGIGGTSFFVDPQEQLFAMLLTQAPGRRIHYRNLFRTMVYAAVD